MVRWERHDKSMLIIATSHDFFGDPYACRQNAVRHGVDVTGMLLAWSVEYFNNGEECTEDASRHEKSFLLQRS